MESLDKLFDVKASDNKHNLLMHVIEEVEKKMGEPLMNDEKDLEDYEAIAKMPTS